MIQRLFDIKFSALVLVFLSPLLALIALWVRLTDGSPVFFRQRRLGRGEIPFDLLKFRTMVLDAPSRGPAITAGGDPRITRVGGFLRRYKLDELPQFWNVLRGEMSVVGPRPEVPEMLSCYTTEERGVFRVRPGITDPASLAFADEAELLAGQDDPQRYYREIHLHRKLAISLEYIGRATIWSDLGVILRTVGRVLR